MPVRSAASKLTTLEVVSHSTADRSGPSIFHSSQSLILALLITIAHYRFSMKTTDVNAGYNFKENSICEYSQYEPHNNSTAAAGPEVAVEKEEASSVLRLLNYPLI